MASVSQDSSNRSSITSFQRLLSDFRGDFDRWQCEFETLLDETVAALGNCARDSRSDQSGLNLLRMIDNEREERRQQQADILKELRDLKSLLEN